MGYHRAGFEVVGVDINPQPHYPFEFHQGDALTWPLEGFDAIHASPPCQAYSSMFALPKARKDAPRLIEPTRARLLGRLYVIENVPPAPLLAPITLCGSMFGLHCDRGHLQRHRKFELGGWSTWPVVPAHDHSGKAVGVYGHGQAEHSGQRMRTGTAAESRQLLDIDWMNRDEMAQAIPPAYTEFLGKSLYWEVIRSL
jgi:DNA (cytosine-5)-methyltransferase 1